MLGFALLVSAPPDVYDYRCREIKAAAAIRGVYRIDPSYPSYPSLPSAAQYDSFPGHLLEIK